MVGVGTVVDRIGERLDERKSHNLFRSIRARQPDEPLIDLSNNDYLRLSRHPQVIRAAQQAIEKWGASSSASPLITGYTQIHQELERRLAAWAGFSSGLVWNTGYAANQAILGLLPEKGDLIIADRLIHNSMISGILRSGARLSRFHHNDLEHLESLLQAAGTKNVFVVTESIYSMDGDAPDMARIAELKGQFGFTWIVDEAHAIGWYGDRGSGLAEDSKVTPAVDIYVGTLGKGLGSMGAFTLFHHSDFRDYLINFAGEFIYSTYLAPSCAGAALAAVDLAESMSAERQRGRVLAQSFREALKQPPGDSPIVPIVVGETDKMFEAAARVEHAGFKVGTIRPPTVPEGTSRLRISLNTELTDAEIRRLTTCLTTS